MIRQIKTTGKLKLYAVSTETELELPFMGGISAGFPSPAADFLDTRIDLNKHLIKHPDTTLFAEVDGYSMSDQFNGIGNGDLLVVDKSLEPLDGKVAVCVINGEHTLKRLKVDKEGIWLMPDNEKYPPIKVSEYEDFEIWGMVTFSIKKLY